MTPYASGALTANKNLQYLHTLLHGELLYQFDTLCNVPAWAKGFDQDTSVFSMIGVTGSIPKFRNPENFWKGRLDCSGPSAVAHSHATG